MKIQRWHGNWHFVNLYERMLDAKGFPGREYFVGDGIAFK